jgi:hypothetical protein
MRKSEREYHRVVVEEGHINEREIFTHPKNRTREKRYKKVNVSVIF